MRHLIHISAWSIASILGVLAGESANYSTSLETLGASAGYSSSTNYQQHAEAGAESVSISSSGPYVARHGFAGQLALPLAVTFFNEDIADEVSTFQILPGVIMDDFTYINAPQFFMFPLPSDPLILSISPAGLIEFGAVYEETPVTVRATAFGLEGEMTVYLREVDPDNFGSYAGDWLNDGWQILHFGLENPEGLAAADPDGDGDTNLFEFHAQLVPTDPASRFFKTLNVTGTTARITYGPIMPGSQYRILTSPNLADWTPLLGAGFTMQGNMRTTTDPNPILPPATLFYRIEVIRQ
jgi:hypothetical protein